MNPVIDLHMREGHFKMSVQPDLEHIEGIDRSFEFPNIY